ncbi:bifunctional diguanylate cyclase/phosphodiesterase [Halomicronema sp. CCY15110]|uniref:putative bifunctional diguanylate cyclase/phosphodiesterase n=1 Tax=Halomicronema sp. CCY15110 TaxID=2767773 RepID=UPI00194FF357|nr:EAL domain-containing protein [Halomicronema sp. CCY15110]
MELTALQTANIATAIAYLIIPFCLVYWLWRLRRYQLPWQLFAHLGLFSAFILSCALTHLLGHNSPAIYPCAVISGLEAIALIVSTRGLADHFIGQLRAQRLLQGFLDNAQIGMMAFDAVRDSETNEIVDFRCTLENDYARRHGSPEPMTGRLLIQAMPHHLESGLFEQYCRSTQGENITAEFSYPELGWFQNRSFPLLQGFGVTFANITTLKNAAIFDRLTGLYNRQILDQPLKFNALLYLDLDRFKQVNDLQGHIVGDEVLRQVADRLRHSTRPKDLLVRLGGDEFLVLMAIADAAPQEIALETAWRIHDAIQKPYSVDELILNVGVSVGVYLAIKNDSLDSAIRLADIALNTRKADREKYSPVVLYEPEMGERAQRGYVFEKELKQAIIDGQIVLFYQRVVNLQEPSHPTVGFEALVRWQHPEKGLILPQDFIPMAEKSGLIGLITDYVLAEAYRQACVWNRFDQSMKMSINLSAYDLTRSEFLKHAQKVLQQGILKNNSFGFELTEKDFADLSQAAVLNMIKTLKSFGAGWAIDDAGTGYNGLGVVSQVGGLFDVLKIDRSFISGPQASLLLCDAFCAIANHFGMEVIAEGIETQYQAQALTKSGVQFGQGFYFEHGEPLAAAAMEAVLEAEWSHARTE